MRRSLVIWIAAVGCTLPLFFSLTPQARFIASVLGALAPAMPWLLVLVARRITRVTISLGRQRQISLRGLLILVALCAVGFAVWDRWLRPGQERRQFMAAVTELQGAASTDSLWIRFSLSKAADSDLAYFASLPGKRKVVEISLKNPTITDAGVAYLANFPELNTLVLDGCQITDEGFKTLQSLPHLRCLYVACPTITDEGVSWLAERRQLWMVNLINTPVTPAKLDELRTALPYCNVVRP